MPKQKKDAKYLNVYITRQIFDEFSAFCEKIGQSKTVAAERALVLYMKEMQKENEKNHEEV